MTSSSAGAASTSTTPASTAPVSTAPARRRPAPLRALAGLTTRGRCLLAAGIAAAVCAVVLNERGLLRIAVFVVALPLLTVLLATLSRVRIAARRSVTGDRVAVGDDGDVRLDLWRTGRLPSGEILLEDPVPHVLGARPRFVVERLPHHTVTLRYPIRPGIRGVHRIDALRATVTDPFGLCAFDRDLAPPSRVVVVPRVTRLRGSPTGSGTGGTESGDVRLHAGQGEPDVMVRQYRTGDDMRKVHWRSTARRDEVMVRVEERPWQGGTTVLLDHRAAAHHGVGDPDGSLEWAVAFAASVCVHLGHAGTPVRLVSAHGGAIADAPQHAGPQADGIVLDALAALRPAHERELTAGTDPGHGQELIAVLGTVGSQGVAELTRSRPRGLRSLAVLVDTASWQAPDTTPSTAVGSDAQQAATLLRASGWGVVVAGRHTRVDEAWTELCGSASRGPIEAGGLR